MMKLTTSLCMSAAVVTIVSLPKTKITKAGFVADSFALVIYFVALTWAFSLYALHCSECSRFYRPLGQSLSICDYPVQEFILI